MRLTVGFLFLCLYGGITCRTVAEQRDFSVEDSIRMSRFNNFYADGQRSPVSASPDRRHYLLLTSRGLLKSNRIESTLWLLDSSSVERMWRQPKGPPKVSPSVLVKIAAVPEDPDVRTGIYSSVISRVRWSPTSDSVYFLAQSASGIRLYKAVIETREVVPISPPGVDVANYDVAGSTLIFLAARDSVRTAEGRELGDAGNSLNRAVTGVPFHAILFPTGSDRLRSYDLYTNERGKTNMVWKAGEYALPANSILQEQLALSPDKRFAVVLVGVETVPQEWEEYRTPSQHPTVRPIKRDESGIVSPYSINPLREYGLVNLQTGSFMRLMALDARFLFYAGGGAVWSATGKRLLLENVFLPLEGAQGAERSRRLQPCAIAMFEVDLHAARCLRSTTPEDSTESGAALQAVTFGLDEDTVVAIHRGEPDHTEIYRRKGDNWVVVSDTDGSQMLHQTMRTGAPLFKIKQGLNELPKLWMENQGGVAPMQLWDPNPQLSQVRFGEVSVYSWKDKSGHNWSGALIKPVGYVPGRRYPLVIQTHGFDGDTFVTDGAYPTAMAARPLASAGIMVLQVGGRFDHLDQLDESRDNDLAYDSVIEALSAGGLVDSTRVGIVGFSRTCWYVETALEEKPHQFAAATIADGVDFGYMQYMLYGPGDPLIQEISERMYGGRPTRGGLAKWMKSAPNFHLDEVQTPLRIEAIGPGSVLAEWEIYSSLQIQGKPAELFYLPGGEHILQRPQDRYASEQGTLEWFRFWLLGTEDPDPAKRLQYERWEAMKAKQTMQRSAETGSQKN